ncbi:MAG: tyrosine--tRNA ligase [Candidatus Symbiobacter sp.]|nr:tyrosine--tRNA ligase [Candidatus Symbiobacter sp.]
MAEKSLFKTLEQRGFIHQVTDGALPALIDQGGLTLYVGYDPTASSLHIGHLSAIMLMRWLQQGGHRVIALVGGGTAPIGDPSGKSAERNLQDIAAIHENGAKIRGQLHRLFTSDGGAAPIFRDNYDWLGKLSLIEFLRDTGKHFSVNAMIQKDSVKLRIEREGEGISFTEFSYALLQARDFLELYERDGCNLQLGGSDQWGNIVGGTDLIRRVTGGKAYGLTCPLLVDGKGQKFGKTEKGAVFVDPAQTTAWAFYQFWINAADSDAEMLLNRFTFLSAEEIAELVRPIKEQGGDSNRTAQKALAAIVTDWVHGQAERLAVEAAAACLFQGKIAELELNRLRDMFADVPSCELAWAQLDRVPLSQILQDCGLVTSKSEARRQIEQGAVTLNQVKLDQDRPLAARDLLHKHIAILGRGKRNFALVRVNPDQLVR